MGISCPPVSRHASAQFQTLSSAKWVDEAADLHQCRRRPDVAKHLAMRPADLRPVSNSAHEYPGAHHLAKTRTDLVQGCLDIAESLPRLAVGITRVGNLAAFGRRGRTGDPHVATNPDRP